MTKKVLLLGHCDIENRSDERYTTLQQLFQTLSENNRYTAADIARLVIAISQVGTKIWLTDEGRDITDFDAILLWGIPRTFSRRHAALVSLLASKHGIRLINDFSSYLWIRSKIVQALYFQENGARIPATFLAPPDLLAHLVDQGMLSLPFIYKDDLGAKGRLNYLIHDLADIPKLDVSDVMIAQEYIPNDHDYRVLLMGDQHLVIRRQRQEGHLNNTSRGAQATLTSDLPRDIIAWCYEFQKKLHRDIIALDILPNLTNSKHYVLEVNLTPQINSGAFIAEKHQLLSDYLKTL